jgi:DNA-binding NarL/FixJ family response regulator
MQCAFARSPAVSMAAVPILVVEDSRNMQIALQNLFHAMRGFEVVAVAESEGAATEWVHQHQNGWDLAVVDLLLQDGSGFNLIPRLKSANPKGHVIVFSEFATPALKDKCATLGADASFLKSELSEFVAYVDEFDGRRTAIYS